MPVIWATWEAEIRRIKSQSKPGQIGLVEWKKTHILCILSITSKYMNLFLPFPVFRGLGIKEYTWEWLLWRLPLVIHQWNFSSSLHFDLFCSRGVCYWEKMAATNGIPWWFSYTGNQILPNILSLLTQLNQQVLVEMIDPNIKGKMSYYYTMSGMLKTPVVSPRASKAIKNNPR
jgi:hypothetical protein